jgi:hypothetical protein
VAAHASSESHTRENIAWLERLAGTNGAPFPCDWRGIDFINGLAAEYPSVIDYHLGNGRMRLEEAIRDLRVMAGLQSLTANPGRLVPRDVQEALSATWEALNRDDPHYRYEFEVTENPPVPRDMPSLVCSVTTRNGSGASVTWHVFARYDDAPLDAPIPLRISIDPSQAEEGQLQALDQALRFGVPVHLGEGNGVRVDADLPAGLGSSGDVGRIWFGARLQPGGEGGRSKWTILPASQDVKLAELVLEFDRPTHGLAGGFRGVGRDSSSTLAVDLRAEPAGGDRVNAHMDISLRFDQLVGLPVQMAQPVLRFLAEWKSPNRLAFGPEYGPPVVSETHALQNEPLLDDALPDFIDALVAISDRSLIPLPVPDLNEVTPSQADLVEVAARVLSGETVRVQVGETLAVFAEAEGESLSGKAHASLSLTAPLVIELDRRSMVVGTAVCNITNCRTDRYQGEPIESGEGAPFVIIPMEDSVATLSLPPNDARVE